MAATDGPRAAPTDVVGEVVLVDYPVELGARQEEHYHDLMREFQLMLVAAADRDSELHIPRRLLDLVELITTRYGRHLDAPDAARRAAQQRGEESVTLTYPAVREAEEVVTAWSATMDEVDAFCRCGDLLTLATPPDVLALRRWTIEEFRRQVAGQPPRPWCAAPRTP